MRRVGFALLLGIFTLALVGLPALGFAQGAKKSIGVRVGSNIWPGQSPFMLPPLVAEYGSILPVTSNVRFGIGVMRKQPNGRRQAVLVLANLGSYFSEVIVPLEISRERPLAKDFSWVTTGSFGLGVQRYRGYSEERLDILFVPFHTGVGFELAYTRIIAGIDLFVGYNVPVGHRYSNPAGQIQVPGVGIDPLIGIDLTVRFGGIRN